MITYRDSRQRKRNSALTEARRILLGAKAVEAQEEAEKIADGQMRGLWLRIADAYRELAKLVQ